MTDTKKENDSSWVEWRVSDDGKENTKTLSKGISPLPFYRRRRRGQKDPIDDFHQKVMASEINEKKKKAGQEQESKRSAFKQVTALRRWPLQSKAFRYFNDLMKQHMHQPNYGEENEVTDTQISSESGSSFSSGDQEPKRRLFDTLLSPAKSQLKVQFGNEFLAEQALLYPVPRDHPQLGHPLWSMEPRIFSLETSETGQRRYIVGHLGRFMDLYWRKTDRNARHYYELIRENTPCRLYFDIEFSKITNPDIPDDIAETILNDLFEDLRDELCQQYPKQLTKRLERSDIVDLDSSTEKKFSRHWIVHLPSYYLFAHTAAAGKFVTNWVGRLAEEKANGELGKRKPLLQKYLFVNAAPSKASTQQENKSSCIIDLGVYTRNRLFRILGSSKFGKPSSAALRIADVNRFSFPEGFGNECFYAPAMGPKQTDCPGSINDTPSKAVQKFLAAMDWTMHAEVLADTFVVPINASKIDFPILPNDNISEKETTTSVSTRSRKPISPHPLLFGKSPYPMIDDFILKDLATRGGVQGSIRAWSIDLDAEGRVLFLTYQMSRNRWCECIGRAHRSNNIMWTVDFVLWQCVQSCHDPECRAMQFRGKPVPLPNSVREEVQDIILEQELAKINEKELLAEKSIIKKEDEFGFDDAAFEQALLELNLDEKVVEDTCPPNTNQSKDDNQFTTNEVVPSTVC